MLPRWSRSLQHFSRASLFRTIDVPPNYLGSLCRFSSTSRLLFLCRGYSDVASAVVEDPDNSSSIIRPTQSKSIRGANVVYIRVASQVDKSPIYDVFSLEKTFKTTFSLLVLHMWLVLRRLKEEGKEGVDFGQYLYEIYNHDVELRVSRAGVNLMLTRWMKDLEKIFYGNVVAYDTALLPEAKQDELSNVIWRNIFSDGDTPKPTEEALHFVQAMSRYVRRESICMSLTDKDAILSGNFLFTSLNNPCPTLAKE